jgi:hypothetical protein
MRRACPRGSTGTSHARRSAARERRCAARAGPSYGLRGQALPKARYDNRGASSSWRKGPSSDQFRMSFDNPSSPLQRGPSSTHIRGPASVSIDITEIQAIVPPRGGVSFERRSRVNFRRRLTLGVGLRQPGGRPGGVDAGEAIPSVTRKEGVDKRPR